MKHKVLFLCTGNSCRSQMSEAIVNARLQSEWQAFSAGTRPEGYVHPMALQALEEIGIHHDGRSKSVEEFQDAEFDAVVTLCDSALDECPVWLGKGKRLHRGFSDPFEAQGTEDEKLQAYRTVRDQIAREIPELLSRLKS